MIFPVVNRAYVVRRKWDLACDGIKSDGLCDFTTRTLWLDADLLVETMADVLRHEHVHAWEAEVGKTRDDEDHANFISAISDSFDTHFEEQGGLKALLAIPIEGNRPSRSGPAKQQSMNVRDRIECGRCGAQVMVGSIASGKPQTMAEVNFKVVERGCQCPVCDAVQVWDEKCTETGLPLGEFHNVRLLVGKEASDWLVQHPEIHAPYNAA